MKRGRKPGQAARTRSMVVELLRQFPDLRTDRSRLQERMGLSRGHLQRVISGLMRDGVVEVNTHRQKFGSWVNMSEIKLTRRE